MKKNLLVVALLSLISLGIWLTQKSPGPPQLKGPFLLLEQVERNPSHYDGKTVKVLCYYWPGHEGPGLSGIPVDILHHHESEQNEDKYAVSSMSIKLSPDWDATMPWSFYMDQSTNELMLMEGIFHASGYQKKGMLLEKSPYLEVTRGYLVDGLSPILPENPSRMSQLLREARSLFDKTFGSSGSHP
ncbi:MAG: hypothetical protein EOP85_20170 [Verrucomicrobiaceae bacterium]|nr:MAG: hypothetical protein EOP85_20170 [Verrucomicrobiaceae bacterium]